MAEPIISTGTSEITERVARTGLQAMSPALILEGLRVFDIWNPDPTQTAWLLSSGTIVFALIQNWWETVKGRKLLGRRL